VNGVIDKLLVNDEGVWIIDYKTTKNLSGDEERKAQKYLGQMNAYEKLIKKVYPDKKIIKAIIFTHSSKMIQLD